MEWKETKIEHYLCPHCRKTTETVRIERPRCGIYICTECGREPTGKKHVAEEYSLTLVPLTEAERSNMISTIGQLLLIKEDESNSKDI